MNPKALVVEDEQIVALDIRRRLTKLGYEVVGMAANAEKALSIIDKVVPDIILMDINIQGDTDGISLAEIISKKSRVPVIYLTAYSEEATLKRAKETKPYGYLLKPFSERDLDVAIQIAIERFRSDDALQKHEQHLRLALNAANLGTWECDQHGGKVHLENNHFEKLASINDWMQFIDKIVPQDRHKVRSTLHELKQYGDTYKSIECQIAASNENLRRIKLHGKSFNNDSNKPLRVVGVIEDITEKHEAEKKITEAATVFQCSTEGIAILDSKRNVTSINNALEQISGFRSEELIGGELPFLRNNNVGQRNYESIWQEIDSKGKWHGEIKAWKKDASLIYLLINIGLIPPRNDSTANYVVIISDITQLREMQDQLTHYAYFDCLTDLPNRNLLIDRFKQSVQQAKRAQSLIAVLFIDLDNFKRVNDTMGHQVGDKMLQIVSRRLAARLRKTDTIGRLGGDEFVVIMNNIKSEDDAGRLAQDFLNDLSEPIMLANTEVISTGSIGISLYPKHSTDCEDLIQMADTAMYAAKTNGRNNFAYYNNQMRQHNLHYLVRDSELRNALSAEQFCLYYQPICSVYNGEIIGAEALIRWNHPLEGTLGADEVISYSESNSLIIHIGRWALDKACSQLRNWLDLGYKSISVSVNVSVKQFLKDDMPEVIKNLLAKYQLPPSALKIEITESCLQEGEEIVDSLLRLDNMGIAIALDDFGTGYSCLSSLKKLPISHLKIDRIFVHDLPYDKDNCAIASTIIAMGHQLQMQVVAEGVENHRQHQFLREAGCEYLQGYFISKPITATEFQAFYLAKST